MIAIEAHPASIEASFDVQKVIEQLTATFPGTQILSKDFFGEREAWTKRTAEEFSNAGKPLHDLEGVLRSRRSLEERYGPGSTVLIPLCEGVSFDGVVWTRRIALGSKEADSYVAQPLVNWIQMIPNAVVEVHAY